mmetsp:Transcript_16569/g.38703  ORF Transcript_16569/g.38703 Transcript_16569/m.38703 type:complete len:189 (+) Transcript_16569:585-1151(+)
MRWRVYRRATNDVSACASFMMAPRILSTPTSRQSYGEQLFHVVKAMLCQDLETALTMVTTTGGPALRGLGREVRGYIEHGGAWEDLDSGLVLLVNITIKLAALELLHVHEELTTPAQRDAATQLFNELHADGVAGLYIAEGAKDDARCGIGIHASDSAVLEKVDEWGRNMLGHACMAVASYCAQNHTS